MVEALRTNKTLKVLGMANNKLNDRDADLLVNALSENSTLEQLDVRENLFHDQGIINIAQVARVSKGLRKLLVVKNPFGTKGSLALLKAVRENHRIVYMDVCRSDSIHQQIHYHTTLNRGGRRLLLERPKPPLALWPLAMERANFIDWDDRHNDDLVQQSTSLLDPRIDVLYHFLQESPVIFEGTMCET